MQGSTMSLPAHIRKKANQLIRENKKLSLVHTKPLLQEVVSLSHTISAIAALNIHGYMMFANQGMQEEIPWLQNLGTHYEADHTTPSTLHQYVTMIQTIIGKSMLSSKKKEMILSDIFLAERSFSTFDKMKRVEREKEFLLYQKKSTQAESLIEIFTQHCTRTFDEYTNKYSHISGFAILEASLTKLLGKKLWSITKAIHDKYEDYNKYFTNKKAKEEAKKHYEEMLSLMLDISLQEIRLMKEQLHIDKLYENLKLFTETYYTDLSKHALPLCKELLLTGELRRGEVQNVIQTKDRMASKVIRELTQIGILISDGPKHPIRLHLNSHLAPFLFPNLLPNEQFREKDYADFFWGGYGYSHESSIDKKCG